MFWGECIYAFSWGFLFTIALPSSVSFVLWFMVGFAHLHVSFFRPLVLFSFSLYCFAPCAYVIMLLFVVILFVATSSMLCHSFPAVVPFAFAYDWGLVVFCCCCFFVLLFLLMIIANYFAPLDLIFRLLSIEKIEIL